jgi:hypothetical protein
MINSWITAHLGKNPINGGKPPSDKSFFFKPILFAICNNTFSKW